MDGQGAEIIRTFVIGTDDDVFHSYILTGNNSTATIIEFIDIEVLIHGEWYTGGIHVDDTVQGIYTIDGAIVRFPLSFCLFPLLRIIRTFADDVPSLIENLEIVRLNLKGMFFSFSKPLIG